jgi:hypothetical protein
VADGEPDRELREEILGGNDVVLEAHPAGGRGPARRGRRDHGLVEMTAQAVCGRLGGVRPDSAHIGEGDLT